MFYEEKQIIVVNTLKLLIYHKNYLIQITYLSLIYKVFPPA